MLLPFGTSMKIFSNAIAFENYDTDQYMRYAMDMVAEDDLSYVNDNNDYYDDQEYQPSYEKDNTYYKSEYPPQYAAADDYKKKNDYYKSKDPSGINQKFKCINYNINIVGADINQLPSGNSLADGVAAQGLEDEDDGHDSNSLSQEGNNDNGVNLDKNIINVCKSINNNVLNAQEPEPLTCEGCFESSGGLQEAIEKGLEIATGTISSSSEGEIIEIPGNVNTIEQLCPLLEGHSDVLVENVIKFIYEIQEPNPNFPQAEIDVLIECLLEAGVIVERLG